MSIQIHDLHGFFKMLRIAAQRRTVNGIHEVSGSIPLGSTILTSDLAVTSPAIELLVRRLAP